MEGSHIQPREIGLRTERVFKGIERCAAKIATARIGNHASLQNLYLEVIRLERLLKQVISVKAVRKRLGEGNRLAAEGNKNVSLTGKEREILALFVKGLSYQETAEVLQCKISTVQTHIKRIYRKLGVHSRAEAAHEAIQMQMIEF